ncbi:unnamed protein product [Fusarium fujikuroi]|nr:unnamed protein product [Fusarium fujikuroi]
MFENLSLRIPYPTPQEGFWGQPTSTLNWCEEDYILSHYTAEITNTLTNVLFIALGIRGVRNCLKYKHDTVFVIAYLGYLLVGCGSFAFHATLSCIVFPVLKAMQAGRRAFHDLYDIHTLLCNLRTRKVSLVFDISRYRTRCAVHLDHGTYLKSFEPRISLTCPSQAYYHYIQDPTFHQNAFSILFLATVFQSLYTMEAILRPMLSKTYTNKPSRASVLSKETRRSLVQGDRAIIYEMRWIVTMGFITCAAGIAAWKVDNIRCSDLVRWRHEVGLPWGILLEGHGWWYVIAPRYCAVL